MPRKILLIDRNAEEVSLIRNFLSDLGYDVRVYDSGERALDFAVNFNPDLVICSADLPVFSGFELARTFKTSKKLSEIPFLLLTYRRPSDREREKQIKRNGWDQGPDDYIVIPISKMDLHAKVGKWLDEQEKESNSPEQKPQAIHEKNSAEDTKFLPRESRHPPRSFRGKVNPFNAGKLLDILAFTQGSWNVRLISVRKKMKISIRDGMIADIVSNYIREDSLGHFLVRQRKITNEESETAFVKAEMRKVRHGEMLVQMGLLTKGELATAIINQKEEKLYTLFTRAWEGGGFEVRSEEINVPYELSLKLPIDLALKRGLLAKIPVEVAESYFAQRKTIGSPIRISTRVMENFQRFEMGLSQRKLLDRIKSRSLDQIKADAELNYTEVLRLVFFLYVLGAVRFRGEIEDPADEVISVTPDKPPEEPAPKTLPSYLTYIPQTEGRSFEDLMDESRELLATENHAAANILLAKACVLDPRSSEALAMLAWSEFHLADKSDAVAINKIKGGLKKAIDLDKANAMAYVYLGKVLKSENHNRVAASYFKEALKIDPHNEDALREIKLLEIKLRTAREKGLDS